MQLRTIWALHMAMPLSERLRRTRDLATWHAAKRLPLRLRYFVTLLEIGKATMDERNVPATPLEDILRKLETPNDLTSVP